MPYKSDAQRRFFHAAEARGDISKGTVKEFDEASKGKKLPEYVKKSKGGEIMMPKNLAKWAVRGKKMSKGGQTFSHMPDLEEHESPYHDDEDMYLSPVRGSGDEYEEEKYAFGGAVPGIEHHEQEMEAQNPGDPRARNFYGHWSEARDFEEDGLPGATEGVGDRPQKPIGRFAKGGKIGLAIALRRLK